MPIIPNKRLYTADENAKGDPLTGDTKSFLGTEFSQPENVGDVFKPYGEDYAGKAKSMPGVKPPMQGPNEQSIVASGMTVEEWKIKHPKAVLGPAPEEIGQITTDPPDGSEPAFRAMEEEILGTEDNPGDFVPSASDTL